MKKHLINLLILSTTFFLQSAQKTRPFDESIVRFQYETHTPHRHTFKFPGDSNTTATTVKIFKNEQEDGTIFTAISFGASRHRYPILGTNMNDETNNPPRMISITHKTPCRLQIMPQVFPDKENPGKILMVVLVVRLSSTTDQSKEELNLCIKYNDTNNHGKSVYAFSPDRIRKLIQQDPKYLDHQLGKIFEKMHAELDAGIPCPTTAKTQPPSPIEASITVADLPTQASITSAILDHRLKRKIALTKINRSFAQYKQSHPTPNANSTDNDDSFANSNNIPQRRVKSAELPW